MPVIILVDRFFSSAPRFPEAMQTVGRGVQHQMEIFRDGAYALQGAAKQAAQVAHRSRPIQTEAFEGETLVSARGIIELS